MIIVMLSISVDVNLVMVFSVNGHLIYGIIRFLIGLLNFYLFIVKLGANAHHFKTHYLEIKGKIKMQQYNAQFHQVENVNLLRIFYIFVKDLNKMFLVIKFLVD